MTLNSKRTALEPPRIADRPHVDQRARQERADQVDVDREAAAHAPLIMPVTISPFWNDSSSRVQVRVRFAFSRDSGSRRKPSSTVSSATSTRSPTLTSSSPRSLKIVRPVSRLGFQPRVER